jgi:hypothetical protein
VNQLNKTDESKAKHAEVGSEEAAWGFQRHLGLARLEVELPLHRGVGVRFLKVGHDDPDESGQLLRPRPDSTRAGSGCKRNLDRVVRIRWEWRMGATEGAAVALGNPSRHGVRDKRESTASQSLFSW